MALTPSQQAVMQYYAECVEEDFVIPFQPIADHLAVKRSSVKRAVRQLARLGYLELSVGFREDDGLIAGSGDMLTREGRIWAREYRHNIRAQQCSSEE